MTNNTLGRRLSTVTKTSLLTCVLATAPAWAQDQDDQDILESDGEIEEVIVTVERRSQSLQSFAGTAARFNGEDLKSLGVQNVQDLNGKLPGLAIGNNQGNIEIFIRGIGNENNTELGLPRVATLIDGVFIPRPRGFGSVFFDISGVEVQVGPQGTLRGRNATGGTVNVVPIRPGLGIWDAAASIGYGNFNTITADAVANIPIGDNLAVRFAASYLNNDSYYNNVGPVDDVDVAEAQDNFSWRGSIYWEPTDRFSAYITGDFTREDGTGFTGTNFANPIGNGLDIDDIADPRAVLGRAFTPQLDTNHFGIKGTFQYDFDLFSVEYTGSFRSLFFDYKFATPLAPDFPGVLDTLGPLDEAFDNFSAVQTITDSDSMVHELRFFRDQGPLLFSAGIFYFREDQFTFFGTTSDRGTALSGSEFNLPDADRESLAGYVDFTYEVTPKFRVTGGVRYTDEELSRFGVNALYDFALGVTDTAAESFGLSPAGFPFAENSSVRIGTQGFDFAAQGRTIFNPDTDGSGTVDEAEVLAFFFDGVAEFGVVDTVDDIFANGAFGGDFPGVPLAPCEDLITTDTQICNPVDLGGVFPPGTFPPGFFTFGVPIPDLIAIQNGLIEEEFVSFRGRLEYDITPDNLAYFSVSRAQNAGGFNDNVPGSEGLGVINPAAAFDVAFATDTLAPEFGFETLTSYEMGLKNEFVFSNWSMTLNAVGFFYDYDDQQLSTLTSIASVATNVGIAADITPLAPQTGSQVVTFTFNAESTRVFGAQFDGGFRLPFNINFDWQFLWLETEIVDSIELDDPRTAQVVPGNIFELVAPGTPGEFIPLPGTPVADLTNINGNDLTRSPRFSLTGNLSHGFDLPTGRFEWKASVGWRSRQFLTIFNSELDLGTTIPNAVDGSPLLGADGEPIFLEPVLSPEFADDTVEGYAQVDLGVKYIHGDGRYALEAFVNNLTNQERESGIFLTATDNTRFFTAPRRFGIQLTVKLNP